MDFSSLTVSCSLRTKTPNKENDDGWVTGRVTAKPVKRRRKKKKSPFALACSRDRHKRFLEKKLAGKPDLASPEDKRIAAVPTPSEQDSDNSLCEKELENTGLNPCGSSGVLVSSKNPTPAPASDSDLLNESAILLEYLDTKSIDSDDDLSSVSVCANCKHPGLDLKRCWRCHTTRYCSVQCQRKDWDFHRFACTVFCKRSGTV